MTVRRVVGRSRLVASTLATIAIVIAPTNATATPTDPLAYWGGANRIATATTGGAVAQTFDGLGPYFSIGGGTLVGIADRTNGKGSDAFGFDASTGLQSFTIKDASFPLVSPAGGRVVFLPDSFAGTGPHERDPTLNSVWAHNVASGTERELVHFKDSDRIPLNLALSPDGSVVAITHGNDQDLFQFDIYSARTDIHRVRRLTTNGRSLYPSFSPNGTRIAYTSKDGTKPCTGSIRLMKADGSASRLVAKASCARVLLRPVWLDPQTLVAWAWHGSKILGLVTVDVASGAVAPLLNAPVVDYSVSRSLGEMAVRLRDSTIELYDIAGGTFSSVPGGTSMKGWRVFLDGALELAY